MGFPTIVFNNSTGSDSNSGAGPGDGTISGTVLSGTAASFTGSVVTLDGSPDLTDVTTDGTTLLYLTTTTGRRFFTINAKDNGADTVTLDDAPAGTASGLTWAIGGKRSTLHATDSKLIITADGKKGWTLEVQYTGTDYQSNGSAGTINFGSGWAGDSDEIGLTFKGTGAQRPLIKLYPASPGTGYDLNNYSLVQDLRFQVENPGDVYGNGLTLRYSTIRNCDIHFNYSATQAIAILVGGHCIVDRCRFTGTAVHGIQVGDANPRSISVTNCYFEGMTGTNAAAIHIDSNYCYGVEVIDCVFNDCYWGMYLNNNTVDNYVRRIRNNTFYNSPIKFNNLNACTRAVIEGNIFSHCDGTNGSGYAIVRPSTYLQSMMIEDWNCFYSNTSGNIDNGSIGPNSSTGTDPGYTNAAGGDFSIGTVLKGLGAWGGEAFGSYTSYPDPGAVQRQEPVGGGGGGGPLIGGRLAQ